MPALRPPPHPPTIRPLQWCLRRGVYAASVPANLEALPGEPCEKIDGITCIRRRQTIVTALSQADLVAFQPAPPSAEAVQPTGAGRAEGGDGGSEEGRGNCVPARACWFPAAKYPWFPSVRWGAEERVASPPAGIPSATEQQVAAATGAAGGGGSR